MLLNKSIAVVVPCFNEERQIGQVLATLPDFVDLVVVVNDASTDGTGAAVQRFIEADHRPFKPLARREQHMGAGVYDRANNLVLEMEREAEKLFLPSTEFSRPHSRVVLLTHARNGGKGAGVATGYRYTRNHGADCTAIMDGDGQMDPGELERMCRPVLEGRADYCKGNRFKHRSARRAIPRVRLFGNGLLSILTKIATGYWRVSDAQTGFTAISREALESLELHALYPRYGVHNDLLQKLNIANFIITEVPITPHYAVGEQSKMKIPTLIPRMSALLLRLFVQRLFKKYLYQSFHPLFLLYLVSFLAFLADLPLIYRFLHAYFAHSEIMLAHLTLLTTIGIFSFQSLVFAMWFDMNDNDRLYV